MTMTATNLELIRIAIDEPTTGTFTDEQIADAYETLNNNKPATIAFFLLSKATALEEPTAPTVPSIEDSPDTSIEYWDKKIAHDMTKFGHDLSLYREQMTRLKSMSDLYKAQAQIYLEAAKNGEFS